MVFRRILLVCTVAALLLFAGCLGTITPDGGSETDPESEALGAAELVERSQSAQSELDSIRGTMTTTMSDRDERVEATYDVWMRPPGDVRMEFIGGDEGAGQPGVMVVNGSSTWMYDEATNRAVHMDLGYDPAELAAMGEELAGSYDDMDAERVGTDTVADRSVTVVELTGDGSSPLVPEEMTLWIDEETYYPLKYELSVPGQSDVSMTVTFEAFDPDAEIADARFAFEPPADATVLEFDDLPMETHEDVESAARAVPFDVPEPTVPEAYAFDSATTMENLAGWSASLQDTTEAGDRLTITVAESPGDPAAGLGGEPITIGDVEATVTSTDVMNVSSTSVTWTSDELTYTVSGTEDEETLRAVAESIAE